MKSIPRRAAPVLAASAAASLLVLAPGCAERAERPVPTEEAGAEGVGRRLDEALARLLEMQKELQRRHEEVGRLQREIERLHREAAKHQSVALAHLKDRDAARAELAASEKARAGTGTELEAARRDIAALRKENERLAHDLHRHAWVVKRLKDAGVKVTEIAYGGGKVQSPVEIHGKVLAARPGAGLVMLSVGRTDRVEKGIRFTVHRDGEHVGKVEVEKTFDDMCSARILQEWTRGEMKVGDDVSTHPPRPGAPSVRPGARPPAAGGAARDREPDVPAAPE